MLEYRGTTQRVSQVCAIKIWDVSIWVFYLVANRVITLTKPSRYKGLEKLNLKTKCMSKLKKSGQGQNMKMGVPVVLRPPDTFLALIEA